MAMDFRPDSDMKSISEKAYFVFWHIKTIVLVLIAAMVMNCVNGDTTFEISKIVIIMADYLMETASFNDSQKTPNVHPP
jgi:hypothetical protein